MISVSERPATADPSAGPGPDTATVTFHTKQPGVTGGRIALVGDFNGWDHHRNPMEESDEGTWSTVLELPPGRYRFRYLSEDGQWFNDEAAHSYDENEHGGHDSVLDLSSASADTNAEQVTVSGPNAGATPPA